ncbi:MAG: hypothetical protein EU536_01300 [Promethearchaeota archaeon]|nr:MAG: hypothetical protein EU536_01300 [Candidatus Lokiarchaeota archaeon]
MSSKSAITKQHLRLLEAILFIAERPIPVEEIRQKLVMKNENDMNQLLSKLRENLQQRRSFIEIVEMDNGQTIEMRIALERKRELEAFRTKKTLSKELMQTLAYIALKQPLKYNELRMVKGNKAKSQVEELEREGFIEVIPSGRTKILTTTHYFASVFNIDPDLVRDTFKEEVRKRMLSLIEKRQD